MNEEPSFETDLLISGCLNVSQSAGIAAPYLIGHALLFATAVLGGSASYRTCADQAPQLIATPATLLSSDEQCPSWFSLATGEAIELQGRITRRAEARLPIGLTPAQVKMAKRMVKANASLRHILPNSLQSAMAHGLATMTPASFQLLHDVRNGSLREGSSLNAYGPHLIAYAEGEACYRDLIGKRWKHNSLYAAASSPSAAARVTIHGWAEFTATKSFFRKQEVESIHPFGVLLKIPGVSGNEGRAIETSSLYMRFFNLILQLRIGCPRVFMPDPEVIEILNEEVRAQAARSRLEGADIKVVNPCPMLPWNIATVLWTIERGSRSAPENIPALVEKACRIARFSHELHIHTARRIFPTSGDASSTKLDASIVDKVSVAPLQLRELMRKIHRSEAGILRSRLQILEGAGLIFREESIAGRESSEKWCARPFPIGDFNDIPARMSARHRSADEERNF